VEVGVFVTEVDVVVGWMEEMIQRGGCRLFYVLERIRYVDYQIHMQCPCP
jgi:hypothetical protein